ncbi:MATE family efflux transporter [Porphyromonas levii]|uniref:MATE family efflux transporter n=1 Tax=Porphyromonas levii TaxID=28114 RepID=A0A4Y8WQ32_9PORP|nr:MATE family efflux transporter [Porphyromonas levii]TFH94586.1 MATE family efflux transporter [Porphyromonas levii]TFH95745.1 MATE family efflux transporter [Porphyromonas levii]
MQRQTKDLTHGPIAKQLVQLSLPILGTSFVQMLYSFTDMAWLGRLSPEAVAATGAASVFTWLANSVSLLNKVSSEVGVANALGRNDEAEARAYASHTSTLGFLLGMGVLLLYGLGAEGLIGFYKMASDIHSVSVDYLRIASLGMPLIFMIASYTGTYNATGHSKIPFVINTIGLGMNMLLDPLFIFVLGMEVKGAAWATVLSQAVVLVMLLVQVHHRDKLLGGFPTLVRLQRGVTIAIFKIGTPVALLNSLFAFINMGLGRAASVFGGHIGVMTLTTGGQLEGLCWNTAQGFSTALSAFTGQNYGAQKPERIRLGVRYTLALSLGVGVLGFLLYYFWGEELFALIVPDVAAYTAGAIYLKIQALPQIFSMLEITSQGYFYGVRRTIPPAIISIVGNSLRIPAALILLPITQDVNTLWWIIAASSTLKGLAAGLWYLRVRHQV